MRILWVLNRSFNPPLTGGTLRPFHLLSGLAQRHDVVLVDHNFTAQSALTPSGVAELQATFKSSRALLRVLHHLPSRKPLSAAYYSSKELTRAVQGTMRDFQPHVAVGSGASIGGQIAHLSGVKRVVDLVDSYSAHLGPGVGIARARFKWMMRLETERMARHECELVAKADLSLVTSTRDAEAILGSPFYSTGEPHVLPNGVDTEFFHPGDSTEAERIVFVGDLRYPPNEEGVMWFSRRVLPLIVGRVPSAEFVVVGVNPSPAILSLAEQRHITVTGRVDDVRPYMWDSALVIAPLLQAGGIQNKVLEAMACGLPTVVTPQVAAGLTEGIDGEHLVVAGSTETFAASVVRLLEDGATRVEIGRAARNLVEQRYTWDRIVGDLEDMLIRVQET